jgi:hypothetical protein
VGVDVLVGVEGAVAGAVGVVGAADVGACRTTGAVTVTFSTGLGLFAAVGAGATAGASLANGGALLKRTGIGVPADAADSPGSARPAGALAGRSWRPIAKQQAKTTRHSSAVSVSVRTRMAASPAPTSTGGLVTWIVFTTGTRSVWSRMR